MWDILSESRIASDFTDFADFKNFLVKGVANRGGSAPVLVLMVRLGNRTYLVGDLMKAGRG